MSDATALLVPLVELVAAAWKQLTPKTRALVAGVAVGGGLVYLHERSRRELRAEKQKLEHELGQRVRHRVGSRPDSDLYSMRLLAVQVPPVKTDDIVASPIGGALPFDYARG